MEKHTSFDDGKNMSPTKESHTEHTIFEDNRQSCDTNLDNIPKVDWSDMENLGQIFEQCIEQVSHLEMRRDELIKELLFLQEPMMSVVEHLRGALVDKWKLVTLAEMDYMFVLEEVQQVKRKLFVTTRDCIRSHVTLAQLEYQVAQSALTKEELNTHIQTLKEELSQLQEAHQNQLTTLRDQAKKPYRSRAMSDVSQCRQASVRLQRRLSVGMKEVENWYEPRLIALLKRRQFGEKALRMSKEQAVGLRTQLGTLKEEVQRLEEKRFSMEQRINLMEQEREELTTQHKEVEEELKETLRKLALEFEIKKRYSRDLQTLTSDILKELLQLRLRDEPSEAPAKEHAQDSTCSQTT
ncbi:syncoilin-like isoform X1 [Nerophis ophidion]|uniref:syncoilin-like isoform X1 n=1 Tax=Nerophis ophidion TaxID=159077 RepID=UPI002AE040DD|nr:syncoilin-like isoform X1 [Nerophis ophidion]